MKHVLSVQDLSCVGRCSLTVALPVLSAMALQCSVLPTAVLSTHTGFPQPETIDLSSYLEPFFRHWTKNGIRFDMISIGYLSHPDQANILSHLVETAGCPVILDPVMGDGGKLYRNITPAHTVALRQLCGRAAVVLPNLTEAAALTGLYYRDSTDSGYLDALMAGILSLGAGAVVLTGIHQAPGRIGFCGRSATDAPFFWQGPAVDGQFHGTGDLFTAVLTGCLLRDDSLPAAAQKAAEFVRYCVEGTPTASRSGIDFERQLYRLHQI